MLVSPDMGGAKRCTWLASELGLDFALIHKERQRANEISRYISYEILLFKSIKSLNRMILVGDVKDKTCIIIDDMSDTCGTLCKAADVLKQSGANKVIGIVTHGVMSGAALDKVRESPSLELLVVTNTIPQETNVATCHKMRCVDVTPTFAEALRCKQERQSMDNVFRMDMFEKLVLS